MVNKAQRYILNGVFIFFAIGSISFFLLGMLGQRVVEFVFGSVNPYTGVNIFIVVWVICLYGVMLSYCASVINFIGYFFPKNNILKKWRQIYTLSYAGHSLVFFITFPLLTLLLVLLLNAYTINSNAIRSFIATPFIFLIGAVLYYIVGHLVLLSPHKSIVLRLILALVGFAAMLYICFISFAIVMEISPHIWGDFRLDDPKGVYIINDDGDYWLTYYTNQQTCWNKYLPDGTTEKVCQTQLEKKGNTAIIEAPEDLKKYLDKPVRVTGTFVRTVGSISSSPAYKAYRKFCIVSPQEKDCHEGRGAGIWYYSPLKITQILLVQ